MCMRLSCIFCSAITLFICLCGGVRALTGFDLLGFVCLFNDVARDAVLAAGGVCALFLVYALIALKPFRGLK